VRSGNEGQRESKGWLGSRMEWKRGSEGIKGVVRFPYGVETEVRGKQKGG
jgi:hypothetical protein